MLIPDLTLETVGMIGLHSRCHDQTSPCRQSKFLEQFVEETVEEQIVRSAPWREK